jgi:hypothetical protein
MPAGRSRRFSDGARSLSRSRQNRYPKAPVEHLLLNIIACQKPTSVSAHSPRTPAEILSPAHERALQILSSSSPALRPSAEADIFDYSAPSAQADPSRSIRIQAPGPQLGARLPTLLFIEARDCDGDLRSVCSADVGLIGREHLNSANVRGAFIKGGIVNLYGVFSCGRLLNECADSPDDLTCAISLLDNKRERVVHLRKIRWLRA